MEALIPSILSWSKEASRRRKGANGQQGGVDNRSLVKVETDDQHKQSKEKADFGGVKVNKGQQDKHVQGTNYYKQSIASGKRRSVLTENPQQLLDNFAGSGQRIS